MRFGRRARLILTGGIIVILLATMGVFYSRQLNQQRDVEYDLAMAQANLPNVIALKEDLERQLAQAIRLLNTSKESFPDTVESIEVGELLFEIADDLDLEVLNFEAEEPVDYEVDDIIYSTATFRIEVRGDTGNILNFIYSIRSDDDFGNAKVEMVELLVPQPSDDEVDEEPSATIELTIYGYEGG